MQLKKSAKWLSLIGVTAVFSTLVVVLSLILRLSVQDSLASIDPIYTKASQSIFSEPVNPGIPIRLLIPKIKVDAKIESVGLTAKGAVGVPKKPANTAWFNLGARPGNKGSAIIDGHYGRWKNGDSSVFDNLNKLKKGDKIYVKDDKGSVIVFVVRKSQSYDLKADASAVFYASDDKAHLNLITCEGVWNSKTKTYYQRLVVFADREET